MIRFTSATDGSFALDEPGDRLDERRSTLTPHPVTWLSQVHGSTVVDADRTLGANGARADAVVTAEPDLALTVVTADCAPVVLATPHAVAAVHAGWKGLLAGVVPAAVEKLLGHGDGPVTAWLGPCIRARCYEFGADDLDAVAGALGDEVRSVTAWGTPALDVTAAVTASLRRAGVDRPIDAGVCTACSPVHFSHRARGDRGRQAAFVWLEK